MYNLFLDDKRTLQMAYDANPGLETIFNKNPIVIVKNMDEFVKIITEKGLPKIISFDHDLADLYYEDGERKERDGKKCAEWLGDYCMENKLQIPQYYVHSDNPVGKNNIKKTLEFYAKYIERN